MNIDLLLSDEAERLYKENEGYLTSEECIDIVLFQKEKYLATNQNKQGTNLNKIIIDTNNNIPLYLDINKDEVYNRNTGETVGVVDEF